MQRFVLSPPCLVFVGCSLNAMYSVPLSSSQNLKSSTSIERCSWRPLSQNCWITTHHIFSERTSGLESPILFVVQSISSSSAVSALAAFILFPFPCWRRCFTFQSSTNKTHGQNSRSRTIEYFWSFSFKFGRDLPERTLNSLVRTLIHLGYVLQV